MFIKPDMSPAEQQVELILLKERWSLIQGGFDRKSIKIHNDNNVTLLLFTNCSLVYHS